jgi:hypothetical protein
MAGVQLAICPWSLYEKNVIEQRDASKEKHLTSTLSFTFHSVSAFATSSLTNLSVNSPGRRVKRFFFRGAAGVVVFSSGTTSGNSGGGGIAVLL